MKALFTVICEMFILLSCIPKESKEGLDSGCDCIPEEEIIVNYGFCGNTKLVWGCRDDPKTWLGSTDVNYDWNYSINRETGCLAPSNFSETCCMCHDMSSFDAAIEDRPRFDSSNRDQLFEDTSRSELLSFDALPEDQMREDNNITDR